MFWSEQTTVDGGDWATVAIKGDGGRGCGPIADYGIDVVHPCDRRRHSVAGGSAGVNCTRSSVFRWRVREDLALALWLDSELGTDVSDLTLVVEPRRARALATPLGRWAQREPFGSGIRLSLRRPARTGVSGAEKDDREVGLAGQNAATVTAAAGIA